LEQPLAESIKDINCYQVRNYSILYKHYNDRFGFVKNLEHLICSKTVRSLFCKIKKRSGGMDQKFTSRSIVSWINIFSTWKMISCRTCKKIQQQRLIPVSPDLKSFQNFCLD